MDDFGVDAFLGKVTGFERHRGMLDMKRMPTRITDSKFQGSFSSLLKTLWPRSVILRRSRRISIL